MKSSNLKKIRRRRRTCKKTNPNPITKRHGKYHAWELVSCTIKTIRMLFCRCQSSEDTRARKCRWKHCARLRGLRGGAIPTPCRQYHITLTLGIDWSKCGPEFGTLKMFTVLHDVYERKPKVNLYRKILNLLYASNHILISAENHFPSDALNAFKSTSCHRNLQRCRSVFKLDRRFSKEKTRSKCRNRPDNVSKIETLCHLN